MSADELPVDDWSPTLAELVVELDESAAALSRAAQAEIDAWQNWERRQAGLVAAERRRREAVARYEANRANPADRPVPPARPGPTIET